MNELVVEVDVDARWVPLALAGDVDAECALSAREVLRLRGVDQPESEYVEHVAALLAGLSRIAREDALVEAEAPTIGAWALMPEEESAVLGVATLSVAGGESLDEAVRSLVVPDAQRFGEPSVESVETPAGAAARVAQRLVGADARIRDWRAYVWSVPQAGHLVLAATFFDPVETVRWGDAFDDLARLVTARVEET